MPWAIFGKRYETAFSNYFKAVVHIVLCYIVQYKSHVSVKINETAVNTILAILQKISSCSKKN